MSTERKRKSKRERKSERKRKETRERKRREVAQICHKVLFLCT